MANIPHWISQHLVIMVIIGVSLGLIACFFLWLRLDAFSREKLRESLFRNIGVPYRNLIGLLLGSIAAILLMSACKLDPRWIALIFFVALAATILLLIYVRPSEERKVDRFAWGLLVIIVLGFGLGALIYQYRAWWKWLWNQYRRINTPDELILESLFLLGVILGVYVVRNWAKDQKAFQESLSGALAGTFVATVLGKLQEGLTPLRAFAYYGLGFTMSATLNLLLAGRLTANYVNKRSITSRALLDFLYGSERTKLIDGYFLQNFEEDKDYAKKQLTATLIQYRKLVAREFAGRLEKRRTSREQSRIEFARSNEARLAAQTLTENRQNQADKEPKALDEGKSPSSDESERLTIGKRLKELEELEKKQNALQEEAESPGIDQSRRLEIDNTLKDLAKQLAKLCPDRDPNQIVEILDDRWKQLDPTCSQLKAIRDDLERLAREEESITSSAEPHSPTDESRLNGIRFEIKKLQGHQDKLKSNTNIDELCGEWWDLNALLSHLKPSYFYWLIAIECEEKDGVDDQASLGVPEKDRLHDVVYKYLGSNVAEVFSEHSHVGPGHEVPGISEKMIRVSVAARRRDSFDYVVAPGEYGKSFPVFGSVAGLAAIFKQTIVMDRDRRRTFRDKQHNICPKDIEQDRGLDEVDFLSYISIPILNTEGDPTEAGVGIVNIDTKLFVTQSRLQGDPVKACEEVFRTRLTPRQLTEFASNLYEQDDEDVTYIEKVTRIITPVVVLYAKCQVGAT